MARLAVGKDWRLVREEESDKERREKSWEEGRGRQKRDRYVKGERKSQINNLEEREK